MIDKFLNAKHWQLFILLFGIPFIVQTIMMKEITSQFDSIANQGDLTFPDFSTSIIVTIVVTVLYSVVYYSWIWSLGIGLQSKIPQQLSMNVSRFKAALIFPIIYLALLCVYIYFVFTSSMEFNLSHIAIMIPFHLISMFCMIYSLYFVGKTIKTAELKEEIRFSDFIAEFLLLWVYPVGVWILQPRINRLNTEEFTEGIESHLVE